jgi:homoserine dehydrogenase
MQEVNVAIVGFGTVGTGVARILLTKKKELAERCGLMLNLTHVVDIDIKRKRGLALPRGILTTDIEAVYRDESVPVVVETVGGTTTADRIFKKLLRSGKNVVTANKALLATKGEPLFRLAAKKNLSIGFEASVCGGIPIIGALKEGFIANDILSFMGIVNGTCNYVLTKMMDENIPYKAALKEAQQMGYAEKQPALDVNGTDSAHKLAILARLAFGRYFDFSAVHTEGIDGIDFQDLVYARELGYAVKLLAIGKNHPSALELRVQPTLIPLSHPLASVDGVFNAISLEADYAGHCMLYGKGAGERPTASAIVADLVDVVSGRTLISLKRMKAFTGEARKARMRGIDDIESCYYLRFSVLDKPGVLGRISTVLGRHGISILSVIQKELRRKGPVPVVIMTHLATERNVRAALKTIDKFRVAKASTVCLRVEMRGESL